MKAQLCARKDCDRKGEWSVIINIPAKGWAIDMHQPMQMTIGLPLCREHAHEGDLSWYLTEEGKGLIREQLHARRLAEPDFARAWITPIRTSDPKFRDAKRSLGGGT